MGFVKESGTNNTREAFGPSGPIASRRMPVRLYVTCVDDLTKNCKDPTDDDFIIRACPAEFKHHFLLLSRLYSRALGTVIAVVQCTLYGI